MRSGNFKFHIHCSKQHAVNPLLILLIVFGFFPKPVQAVADQAATQVMSIVGAVDPAPQVQEGNR